MKPMISVIIPALNEEKFLPNLLDSLSVQTVKNFEVIVVDGKSRDNTVSIAQAYKKKLPGLSVLVSPKACLPLQRNLGARRASAPWLVFIDADTVLYPYSIERIETYITKHQSRLFTTWFTPDSTNPKDSIYTLFANMYIEATLIMKRPTPPGPLAVVERDAFNTVGGYDEDHAFNEDVDLGLRLRKAGIPMTILRESLYIWSMRRFRKQGLLKVLNQYVISLMPILFFNRTVKQMPGYIMGGHLYDKKKKTIKQSVLRDFNTKLKLLINDFFGG